MRIAYDRLRRRLDSLVSSELGSALQEPIVTLRNGRYVVPIRAEARSRVKGIVHDASGSGATVFVVTLCLTGFAVFLLLLVKLLVAATLALGPIFVTFCLFDATRQWFKNWIGSLVTLVVFQLVLYACVGMGYAIYGAVVPPGELYTASSVNPTQVQGRVLPLLLIFLSLLYVLRKADGHAQALIGSMNYVGDALGHVVRSTSRVLNAAGRRGPRLRVPPA